jgi:hypothetical protein
MLSSLFLFLQPCVVLFSPDCIVLGLSREPINSPKMLIHPFLIPSHYNSKVFFSLSKAEHSLCTWIASSPTYSEIFCQIFLSQTVNISLPTDTLCLAFKNVLLSTSIFKNSLHRQQVPLLLSNLLGQI